MKLSTDRILTTHVGSLPRPDDLVDMMMDRLDGKPVDEKAYNARVAKAVKDTVKHQVDMGFDVVNDGEMGKPSFITYAAQRLDGLEKRAGSRPSPFATSRETRDYPEFYQSEAAKQVSAPRRRALMVCTGPIKYKGHDRLKIELDDLKAAVKGGERRGSVRAGDRAVEHRDHDAERTLPDARGLRVRHRRGDARGIQGDRRRGLSPADRRSVPRHLLHHAAGPQHRRMPQVGRAARRGAERRASPAFPPTASASTPATASTWVRAPTTCSSRTSSTSS